LAAVAIEGKGGGTKSRMCPTSREAHGHTRPTVLRDHRIFAADLPKLILWVTGPAGSTDLAEVVAGNEGGGPKQR